MLGATVAADAAGCTSTTTVALFLKRTHMLNLAGATSNKGVLVSFQSNINHGGADELELAQLLGAL